MASVAATTWRRTLHCLRCLCGSKHSLPCKGPRRTAVPLTAGGPAPAQRVALTTAHLVLAQLGLHKLLIEHRGGSAVGGGVAHQGGLQAGAEAEAWRHGVVV